MKSLSIQEFRAHMDDGFEIVDLRNPDDFVNGFIPHSFYLDLEDEHALSIFDLFIKPFPKLLAVFPTDQRDMLAEKLQGITSTKIAGYLKGGFDTWKAHENDYQMLITIDPDEFELDVKHDENIEIMDIRSTAEFQARHLEGSVSAPLHQIPLLVSELQPEEKLYLLSSSKSTTIAAAAYLNRHGITLIRTLNTSFRQLTNTSLAFTQNSKGNTSSSKSGNGRDS